MDRQKIENLKKLKTIAIASSLSLGALTDKLVDQTANEVKKLKEGVWDSDGRVVPPSRAAQHVRNERKIQRNELCPCQSGKKYKKCCMP